MLWIMLVGCAALPSFHVRRCLEMCTVGRKQRGCHRQLGGRSTHHHPDVVFGQGEGERERKTNYLSNRGGGCPNITHHFMAWNSLLATSNVRHFSTGAIFRAALFSLPNGGHSWRPGSVWDSSSKECRHTDVKKGRAVSRDHQLLHSPKKFLIHRISIK